MWARGDDPLAQDLLSQVGWPALLTLPRQAEDVAQRAAGAGAGAAAEAAQGQKEWDPRGARIPTQQMLPLC
jgi:hypothetical protein